MALGSVKTWSKPEDSYLWQGQLSNDVLRLQGGDQVSILVRPDDVDFGGVDGAFLGGSVIHEQLAVEPYLDFFGGTDNEAGRSHDTFVWTNQSSAVDEQLALELMSPFQEFEEIVVTDEC
ncbi:hypothetical protein L3X38_008970 [Prunus dulcis]|uniref:Uncharacterized protein n=1 Tax=Prunus dulcis TaxID=3755 RepID=A0AAD5F7N2_PRUDU|nr:hypothetical protein L3X38_008970 [Prunus dulcis]